jgi:hypothetical protein
MKELEIENKLRKARLQAKEDSGITMDGEILYEIN